ncbi:MAG TPA: ABC transporter permease, partial [Candidatus Nanoarchaeia archaeon]|nr:ABC transporter permease [Candidatus Nanoarchaeia archaeon]
MRSLWLLIKKNLLILIRAKSSALIVIFAPLLIILILGLSFNNSAKYGLNIGVCSDSFTADVDSVVTSLQEEEFKIVKYEKSLEGCIEDIKLGFVHTCISLPESFQIEGNAQKEITFYVDPSKINLVWMVQNTLQEKLNLKAREISEGLTSEILTKLSDTKTKVGLENDRVEVVKTSNTQALGSIATSQAGLLGLDLAGPTAEYDVSITNTFKSNISTSLNAGLAKVNDAQEALDDANISSSDKSPISSLLAQAETNLDQAAALVNNGSGGINAIVALVASMEADLTAAKNKLVAASGQIDSTTASLESTKASLDTAVSSLNEIKNALEGIKTNLEAQKVTEAGVISQPLVTHIEPVAPRSTHLNYLFSGLIVLVIMFSSLLLGTTLVMMEKHSPAFVRNYFLPVKKITFILSIYFTNLILGLIQVVIIMGIALIFLPNFYTAIPLMALVLFLATSVFTFLWMAVGYIFNSEDTSVLGSISLGSLLLFFSGLILPLESISPAIRKITYYNPFVIAEKLVREI